MDSTTYSFPHEDQLAGRILWLPHKEKLRFDPGLPSGSYAHPFVVLSPTPLEGDDIIVLMVCSFLELLEISRTNKVY